MTVPIRRCPQCGEEFQPHVVDCSDCGALLVDAFEGGAPSGRAADPDPPPEATEYVGLLSGLDPPMVEQASRHLAAAGIPFTVVADSRRGLRLGVAAERVLDSMHVLERNDVVPGRSESTEGAVAVEGGPCPACGDPVRPGAAECPACGLALSGAAPECEHCGAELNPVFDACPECGRGQG